MFVKWSIFPHINGGDTTENREHHELYVGRNSSLNLKEPMIERTD